MSILSNAKAQMNKMYVGAKQAPLAKGIKNVLYEENLKKNTQTKILTDIYKENKHKASILPDLQKATDADVKDTLGMAGEGLSGIAKANMKKVSDVGIDSIEEGNFKKFLNGRFKDDEIARELQNRAIINKAKVKSVQEGITSIPASPINNKQASSFILDAAREVDGQVSFMTPLGMAKEYYGKPLTGAVDKLRAEDYSGALKNVGVAGARVGATAGAVAGAGALAHGAASVTSSAFNRLRGNENNGG